MNVYNVTSLIRTVLLAVGAGLVTTGKIDDSTLKEIVGGLLSLGAFIWSQYHHTNNPPTLP